MFITFEGIEGCGKTTQIGRLERTIANSGIAFIRTLEPGGTGIGMGIRKILLDSRNTSLSPLTELILIEADRSQHVAEVIGPALERGDWVLCDRYSDATVAYQGGGRGQDMDLIAVLNEKATRGIRPDRTFLLDCPVEEGIRRAQRRNETGPMEGLDRFEREDLDFHRRVRETYQRLAQEEPDRFVVIDADRPEDLVEKAIFEHMRPLLEP